MTEGRHLKVVGYGDRERLGSAGVVEDFLRELVATLGMRPLGAPIMHDVAIDLSKLGVEPFEDEGGITGTVVLSTSHCAIHTWPARARPYVVADIFSCRMFETDAVEALFRDRLGVTRMRMTDLSFALEPPDDSLIDSPTALHA